jgi:arsenical pump membrane protein
MLHGGIGIGIFVLTMAVVFVRPYKIPEAAAACGGAVLMIAGGFISPREALAALAGEWNIYLFFFGLMTVTAFAEKAGIFEGIAHLAAVWGRGNTRRLYLAIFGVGAIVTAFLSNDATALILTPIVYVLATQLRLPVLPFMYACTFVANGASFILPVSNPINILFSDAFGNALPAFLRYMLVPSVLCIAFNALAFLFIFRRELHRNYHQEDVPSFTPADRRFFNYTLVVLGALAAAYVAFSAFRLPLSLVALAAAIALSIGAIALRVFQWRDIRGRISWSLFPFITGMFIIIRAVEGPGITVAFGHWLLGIAGSHSFPAVLLSATGTALGANLINNVPMALVMISSLGKAGAGPGLVYASMLGADVGPSLTVVGSLSTIMWSLILRRKGLEVSSLAYFRLGLIVVPIIIVAGSFLIWLGV